VEPKAGYPIYKLKLRTLQHLLPGESPGLDTICDGILGKGPFVLRDKSAPVGGGGRGSAGAPELMTS